MASQFSAEDQTDEDFFDKLVEDDFSVTESTSASQNLVRESSNSNLSLDSDAIDTASTSTEVANRLSNISLDDKVSTIHVSEVDSINKDATPAALESSNLFVDENKTVVDSSGKDATKEELVPTAIISSDATSEKKGEDLGAGLPGGGSKGTSVKQVQWSAFGSDSGASRGMQQFGNTGFESYTGVFGDAGSGDLNQDFLQNPVGDQFGGSFVQQDAEMFANQGFSELQDLNNSFYAAPLNQNDSEFLSNSSLDQSQPKAVETAVQTELVQADPNEIQNWENQYPGWKYDYATGTWYQVDNFDPNFNSNSQSGNFSDTTKTSQENLNLQSEVSYVQQPTQPVLETIAEENSSTVNTVSGTEYPPNMVFDPQYPGWYYDTNTQQWYALELYTPAEQATASSGTTQEQVNQGLSHNQSHNQTQLGQELGGDWSSSYASNTVNHDPNQLAESFYSDNTTVNNTLMGSFYGEEASTTSAVTSSYYGTNTNVESFPNNDPSGSFYGNNLNGNLSGSFFNSNEGFKPFEPVTNNASGVVHSRARSLGQFGQTNMGMGLKQVNSADNFYGEQNAVNFKQPNFGSTNVESFSQFGYNPKEERSSAGRPAHALVTFGFGGKLVIMKDSSSYATGFDFGSQGATASSSISVLNISEIVKEKTENPNIIDEGALSYFRALCHQSFPGPLVGSNAATKDVNKWLDERIAGCESLVDFQKGEYLKLLLSLLKIMCQHYGKLRSPFGSDPSVQDVDGPEMAVTKLFSSAKKDRYSSFPLCIQNFPSESQIRTTALEVQNLLVSGKRKEALHLAQEGQLWGPALVLAAQLGDQFYVETVKKMAQRQFVSGSPLRTLCLLIAGQPADVFSTDTSAVPMMNTPYGAPNAPQTMEVQGGGMLDDWEENLAIITVNRTNDDGLVMIHLGDCLWKEKGEVTAAHTCYLVADANFESFSDTSRLCLVGADHWKCPRTFVSPEAIQRTELYEYAKVLGNSQYVLLPFQPYKLIYAHMLAEVGKVSDSLKYCQASLKLLKSSGRAPELEMWKQLFSSLEERIRTHQQGGYSSNAPTKLVKNIFSSLDRSLQRVMGAPAPTQAVPSLPPMPPTSGVAAGAVGASGGTIQRDMTSQTVPKFVNSQSAMTMSTLMPSASVESISQWANDGNIGGKKSMHNRSVSEPDFTRSPKQSGNPDGAKGHGPGSSRLGWIGGALSKTVGWMSKSHRQAKLGDENKFYYDENLKTWVEKGGKVAPAEVGPLAPPPTTTSFQTGLPDYGLNNSGIKMESNMTMNGLSESKPATGSNSLSEPGMVGGMPPMPPTHNQFSARGRMGVRSRYVDTFNKGGSASAAPTNLFNSPAASTVKPPVGAKFFVPTAAPAASTDSSETSQIPSVYNSPPRSTEEIDPPTSLTKQQSFSSSTSTSPPPLQNLQPTPSTSSSIQRFPSMDNITPHGNKATFGSNPGSGSKGPVSRTRAASWSGSFNDSFSVKSSPPSVHMQFMPNASSSEELQDIQL